MSKIKWHFEYPEDVKRVKDALAYHGIEATDLEAAKLWECYSSTMCAGWLICGISADTVHGMIKEAMNPMQSDCIWPDGVEE